jgi:hypothetical protein
LIEKEILCSSLNFNLPLLKEEVDVEINVGVDVVGQIHWSLDDVDVVVDEVVYKVTRTSTRTSFIIIIIVYSLI